MDISVSQLNNRLALQLPPELPLGLVFVTGIVRGLIFESGSEGNGRDQKSFFTLEQGVHSLRCELRLRAGEDAVFNEGMQIRVGGHLAFDTKQVQYYLLARDVEVVGGEALVSDSDPRNRSESIQDEEALISALASIKRRSEIAQQAPTDLPLWVQKLAPKEVQADLQLEDSAETQPTRTKATPLNEEMVGYLSAAMDSDEDVEITAEMLAQWLEEVDEEEQNREMGDTAVTDEDAQTLELREWAESLADVEEESATAVQPYDPVADAVPQASSQPAGSSTAPKSEAQGTNWLVIIAILALIVFTFALLIYIFGQLL